MSSKKLLEWSTKEYGHLPWRINRSPYSTMVSEFMLQQTTVATVLGKFTLFMEKFPSLESLAKASEEEVMAMWSGLGYYRRARNLKSSAHYFWYHYKTIPDNRSLLLSSKGIGDYTAHAILALGFQQPFLAVDANIDRVLSRYYLSQSAQPKKRALEIEKKFFADSFFAESKNWTALNEALMDVGRVYCQKSKTYCTSCPLNKNCKAFKEGKVSEIPFQNITQKNTKVSLTLYRLWIENKRGEILVVKRPEGKWLEGQWELPTYKAFCDELNFDQYPSWESSEEPEVLFSLNSLITKYKIKNIILKSSSIKIPNSMWIKDIQDVQASSVTQKIWSKFYTSKN